MVEIIVRGTTVYLDGVTRSEVGEENIEAAQNWSDLNPVVIRRGDNEGEFVAYVNWEEYPEKFILKDGDAIPEYTVSGEENNTESKEE